MIESIRINEDLYVDVRFFEFLKTSCSRVSSLILNFRTLKLVNYISISDNSEMVTLLPKSKFKMVDSGVDPYSDGIGRIEMKIGRLISKLFDSEVINQYVKNQSTIEHFVNSYKSHFDRSNISFKVVDGDDIKKYYLERNYLAPNGNYFGTLWNSCMRYKERQKFLELYVKNPNQFKMLVMIQKVDDVEFIRGRSLLCNVKTTDDSFLPKGSDVKVMDRIYYLYDSDVIAFKKWASENGYITKFEQNAKSKPFFVVGDENKFISLVLSPEFPHNSYYPYLDTFSYFKYDDGLYYNNIEMNHDYSLIQFNGRLEPDPPEDEDDENDDEVEID